MILGILVAASVAITFARADRLGRYYLCVVGLVGGAAVVLAWLNDI
ncbi:MAG: hypothetical protein AB1551_06745 [Actinomycetota bacterium]